MGGRGRGEGGEIRCEYLAGRFELRYYYPAAVYNDLSNGASHKKSTLKWPVGEALGNGNTFQMSNSPGQFSSSWA